MSDFSQPSEATLDKLKKVVGEGDWRPSSEAARYFEDPRGRFTGQACLIVMPETTEEVSRIVRICNEERLGLIPYGGGTGVVAGQLSPDSGNAIILSLERMNRIRQVMPEDFALVAEAGCILENIHAAASEHGLVYPLSMASKGSCTVGGNLATNAGGIQVLRHGNARDLCLGVEAVLPSGDVISELRPLRKNNTGYDLRHLLAGSEGTLGIITAATLVLKPQDPETVTALCASPSLNGALRLFQQLRKDLGESLSGIELLSNFGIDLVTQHFPNLKNPIGQVCDWYLLVEVGGQAGLTDRVQASLASCMEKGLLPDAVVASSEAQRAGLWDLRENTPEANRMTGAICNSDTSVPLSLIDRFITKTHEAVMGLNPGLRINSYGHVGDGNIHHNVFPPEGVEKADFVAANPAIIELIRETINEVTEDCGGSISAEHGIGRLKINDLNRYSGRAKLDAIRTIKDALDPNNIMNPGALVS
ncbi:FAD-binding oxidoreductase [Aliiroseovarius sp. M344]|uniref:FAD-binding oxidoreductase n=1 Tax=Aliiroseovarius sp. M344 TaxID=2867010 RepID=UPI0021AE158D|nr:FAD-binding oxidoreductase [Aliiroseovarius sp. M344]UWQ15376.1 FAD-binding oxidoreductase [Aliiroseovarius sp. M344]